jgi:hypothetical protein
LTVRAHTTTGPGEAVPAHLKMGVVTHESEDTYLDQGIRDQQERD